MITRVMTSSASKLELYRTGLHKATRPYFRRKQMGSTAHGFMKHRGVPIWLLFLGALTCHVLAEDEVQVWERWEHVLVSDWEYEDPCREVCLRVRFISDDGTTLEGMGFWDGEKTFVIRNVFPAAGVWTWLTQCSDESNGGLHNQRGTIRVNPSKASSPFCKHGYVRVSDDGRLLVFSDSTPFLWIGDTCWAAPVHATADEWERYVRNRVSKGYSVLQMAISPDWALEHSRRGIQPFLSSLPDISKPNPRFFQELDRMVGQANDSGLLVLLVGLMETPYRYPPPEQIRLFSRYVAARYRSYAVVLSPSFDSPIREEETFASVRGIREAAPSALITMHMGTGVGPQFHAEDWLSFDMFQSGHNGGDRARQSARAIGMPRDILSMEPRKPIINGEAIYEGELGSAYDVRRTAWLSFLSGAVGYTAGIDQIYRWDETATASMNFPSSVQVSLLARFLRLLPWWTLQPAPERILNQPKDKARNMAFAMSDDKSFGVAYLPENEKIVLDLTGCAESYEAHWVSPITGACVSGTMRRDADRVILAPPDARDWALLIGTPGRFDLTTLRGKLAAGSSHRGSKAEISFSKDSEAKGLVLKSAADGHFIREVFGGIVCVANEPPKRDQYLYVDVDDALAFRNRVRKMILKADVHAEEPLQGVQLQYDVGGDAEIANIYRSLSPFSVSRNGTWTTLEFLVENPYFGNRQNAGADFRLYWGGLRCFVRSVEVCLK